MKKPADHFLHFLTQSISPVAPLSLQVPTDDDHFRTFFESCVTGHMTNYARTGSKHFITWGRTLEPDQVVGFIYFYILPEGSLCELFAVGVAPDQRSRGFGLSLLGEGIKQAVHLGANKLIIRWSSPEASGGKLKAGFETLMKKDYSQIRFSQDAGWSWQ